MATSLKHIKAILKELLSHFNWTAEPTTSGTYKFSELLKLKTVINSLDRLKIFEPLIKSLKESVIFTSASDQMSIQPTEAQNIISTLNVLKTVTTNFFETLEKTLPSEDPNSINIKLPLVNDFDELSKVSKEIHVGLTQIILNEEINGETKIISVENGSIWINVFVGTATALSIIASLVWSAAVIYKKIKEGQLLEQQVRSLKVKNESLEDILKAQKGETALMIQAEADHIQSQFFQQNVPENVERIKHSISTFADLINRGAEIHPSLIAPENVANLFPDPTKILGIESKIKKIGNSSAS